MGSIRARKDTGKLFFDFVYQGVRCRELTTLADTPQNRRTMDKMLRKIEAEILVGSFDYAAYFPKSPIATRLAETEKGGTSQPATSAVPLFRDFAKDWLDQNNVRWKRSYRNKMKETIEQHLLPKFGDMGINNITKAEILKFRSSLARIVNDIRAGLSSDRINHIMTPLRMILQDAAEQHHFITPYLGIKQLKVPKSDIDPFSIEEVFEFIHKVRPDFKNYYTVRFFTGMRTSEIDGLKWCYVDFTRKQILIRETFVSGAMDLTKTDCSQRNIDLTNLVYEALQAQFAVTGSRSEYVFCSKDGSPLHYANVSNRVWYPTLERLNMKRRRPYQTRHTTATFWLASGENPEWIAKQMGHANTRMLFTVYSRYVPNLIRRDGAAFDTLLATRATSEVSHAHS